MIFSKYFKDKISSFRFINRILEVPMRMVILLFMSSIAVAITEGMGVSLLLPLLEYIEKDSAVLQQADNAFMWGIFSKVFNFLHLPFNLASLLLVCFIPIFLKQIFIYVNLSCIAKAQFDSTARLQTECFDKLLNTDLSFIINSKIGVFISTLTMEVVRAGQTISFFFKLVTAVALLTAYSVVLPYISWQLTILIVITAVFIQLMVHRHMVVSTIWGNRVSKGNDVFGHEINSKLSAIRLIKLHNTEDLESSLIRKITYGLANDQVVLRKKNALVQITIEPILILGCFFTLYVGITFLGMSFAAVGLFLFILMRMLPLIKELNSLRQELRSYAPSFHNVSNVMKSADAHREIKSGNVPFNGLKRGIIFKNVTFSYEPGKPILRDLSMNIEAGKTTAIVGASGSGKSTITDLIVRLRDIQEGTIFFDDVSIDQIDLATLRKKVGYVSQEAVLLNDTILNNVTYGQKNISLERIREVLEMSSLWDFIEKLPKGLDTIVGDRGAMLSGGERQRLCLARTLLRDPAILILDEPTSALDAKSERYIQETIDKIRGAMTIIVIAHRLSTIKNADRILVLDSAKIRAVGSHSELLSNDNMYRQMFHIQETDSVQ